MTKKGNCSTTPILLPPVWLRHCCGSSWVDPWACRARRVTRDRGKGFGPGYCRYWLCFIPVVSGFVCGDWHHYQGDFQEKKRKMGMKSGSKTPPWICQWCLSLFSFAIPPSPPILCLSYFASYCPFLLWRHCSFVFHHPIICKHILSEFLLSDW